MSYQYIGEDEKVYKIKHADGSEFQVAKNAINKALHERIKSLNPQKMADGGMIEDPLLIEPSEEEEKVKNPLLIEPMIDQSILPNQNPLIIEPVDRTIAAEPVAVAPAPIVQPSVPVQPDQDIAKDYAKAFAQKEEGIKGMANAQARAAQEQAKAYQAQVDQMAQIQANHQAERAKLDIEHNQIVDAIMNDKIDPNRFLGSMNTGNKILAAISVALSGVGSGLSGQPNMAMAVIQKSIDRDIEAQRMELGKKNTLLSENVRRYGDLQTATQATMLQLNAMTQAKIAQAAARSGSQQAQGQAKILLSDLGMQAAQLKQSIATNKAIGSGNLTDAQVQSLPEKVRERAVKVGDKYQLARSEQDARKASEVVGNTDAAISDIDKILQYRQTYGAEKWPGKIKSEMQTLGKSIQLKLKAAENLGTLDKGSVEFLDQMAPDPASIGFVEDKYKQLKDNLVRKAESQLGALGLKYGQSTSSQSPQYATKNGIKYQKVPGGWIPAQ